MLAYFAPSRNFYPRSPCGERRCAIVCTLCGRLFLSTLSLRRATALYNCDEDGKPISIHALLAESDIYVVGGRATGKTFLSTLSLRRATQLFSALAAFFKHFYPRSPCGERLCHHISKNAAIGKISIHALLAESDGIIAVGVSVAAAFLSTLSLRRATSCSLRYWSRAKISIHALLAESDRREFYNRNGRANFYPRSPCGERPHHLIPNSGTLHFYPRSPCGERLYYFDLSGLRDDFYPRSPCGERPHPVAVLIRIIEISIHALLAESDTT